MLAGCSNRSTCSALKIAKLTVRRFPDRIKGIRYMIRFTDKISQECGIMLTSVVQMRSNILSEKCVPHRDLPRIHVQLLYENMQSAAYVLQAKDSTKRIHNAVSRACTRNYRMGCSGLCGRGNNYCEHNQLEIKHLSNLLHIHR
jgi:hypothetical protein